MIFKLAMTGFAGSLLFVLISMTLGLIFNQEENFLLNVFIGLALIILAISILFLIILAIIMGFQAIWA